MKAVLSTRDSRKIEDFDVPEPQAGEVLIKSATRRSWLLEAERALTELCRCRSLVKSQGLEGELGALETSM